MFLTKIFSFHFFDLPVLQGLVQRGAEADVEGLGGLRPNGASTATVVLSQRKVMTDHIHTYVSPVDPQSAGWQLQGNCD